MRRGVQVFSRGSLHTKFVLIDNTLLASSANVSRNSKEVFDEAGIITTDAAAGRPPEKLLSDVPVISGFIAFEVSAKV